jgi:hypothetical protein
MYVRYRHDEQRQKRLETVELIINGIGAPSRELQPTAEMCIIVSAPREAHKERVYE